jgi:hypothetical protein
VPSVVITAVAEGLAELLATKETIEDLVEVTSEEDALMEEDTSVEDDLKEDAETKDDLIDLPEDLTEDAIMEEALMAEEDGAAALEDTEQPDWQPAPQ